MLWEILEARDSARVNRIHMGGRGMEHGTVTDLGDDEADWAPPGAGDRPMMLGKDTASRGENVHLKESIMCGILMHFGYSVPLQYRDRHHKWSN